MICEQLGEEPDIERMPINEAAFPSEVQYAMFLHSLLPDRWEGMSCSYLGKDWSALGTLLEVHEIENRKDVLFFLKYVDSFHSKKMNEELARQRKADESKTRDSDGGIHVQGI